MKKLDKDGMEQHQPIHFSVVFEAAMIKIFHNQFCGVQIVSCLFHFQQANWKKLQEIGLTPLFHRDLDFQEWIHMVYGLCYVPLDKLVSYYDSAVMQRMEEKVSKSTQESQTKDEEHGEEENTTNDNYGSWSFWQDEIPVFMAYLDRTWIGRKPVRLFKSQANMEKRGRPLFAHELWNQVKIIGGETGILTSWR
jgi:hypothetical protein